eukprot:574392-Amorphochlora_amoeboformis.AAC.2
MFSLLRLSDLLVFLGSVNFNAIDAGGYDTDGAVHASDHGQLQVLQGQSRHRYRRRHGNSLHMGCASGRLASIRYRGEHDFP